MVEFTQKSDVHKLWTLTQQLNEVILNMDRKLQPPPQFDEMAMELADKIIHLPFCIQNMWQLKALVQELIVEAMVYAATCKEEK